jgi:hypothetical protein
MVSAVDTAKRVFVTLLKSLAGIYGVVLALTRESTHVQRFFDPVVFEKSRFAATKVRRILKMNKQSEQVHISYNNAAMENNIILNCCFDMQARRT